MRLASQPALARPAPSVQQRCAAQSASSCKAQRSRARPSQRLVAAAAGGSGSAAPPVTLTLPSSSTPWAMPQAAVVVGSGPEADVQLQGANISPAHARLEFKSGRLFCTALAGDPDLLLAPTHCWLDGIELRPGVNYMVGPGARLSVGSQEGSSTLVCNFQEGGSSAMAEMLMKGLAASASKEVQDKLGGM